MQGVKRRPLLSERSEDEHARLRKHFGRFFSAENLARVIERLYAESDAACDAIFAHAQSSAGNCTSHEVHAMSGGIINGVVQKVRSMAPNRSAYSFVVLCQLQSQHAWLRIGRLQSKSALLARHQLDGEHTVSSSKRVRRPLMLICFFFFFFLRPCAHAGFLRE